MAVAITEVVFTDWCARYNRAEVAERMGITPGGVCYYERKYSTRCQPTDRNWHPRILEWAKTMTAGEIAARKRVSLRCVQRWQRRYGFRCVPAPRHVQVSMALRTRLPDSERPKAAQKRGWQTPAEHRARLVDQVAEFLAAGGRVTALPGPMERAPLVCRAR